MFDVFLDFLVKIERNLHYLEKQEDMNLVKDFLNDQIRGDEFSSNFLLTDQPNKGVFSWEV